jgi:rhamnulokinase
VEATALGNILLTARARGLIEGDLEAMRALVARHVAPTRYLPSTRQAAQPVAMR